jgi:hypothetical protein
VHAGSNPGPEGRRRVSSTNRAAKSSPEGGRPDGGGHPPSASAEHNAARDVAPASPDKRPVMNNLIYIVGLVVVVLAVLSFFGLR